jgi:hypothetical protein
LPLLAHPASPASIDVTIAMIAARRATDRIDDIGSPPSVLRLDAGAGRMDPPTP